MGTMQCACCLTFTVLFWSSLFKKYVCQFPHFSFLQLQPQTPEVWTMNIKPDCHSLSAVVATCQEVGQLLLCVLVCCYANAGTLSLCEPNCSIICIVVVFFSFPPLKSLCYCWKTVMQQKDRIRDQFLCPRVTNSSDWETK